MTEAITSSLIVTAPRALTEDQVDQVRAGLARQLPADVSVIVVPPGFTVQPLGYAPASVERLEAQADFFRKQLGTLVDLQKSTARIAGAVDELRELGSVAMRVIP